MDIITDLVHSPKLRHIQWYVYPISSYSASASSGFIVKKDNPRVGLKTKRKGIAILIEFHDCLGEYSVCINHKTIDILPKLDAILLVEQIVYKIDKISFFKLLLSKLLSKIYHYPYPRVLGYLSLWEKVQQNEETKNATPNPPL